MARCGSHAPRAIPLRDAISGLLLARNCLTKTVSCVSRKPALSAAACHGLACLRRPEEGRRCEPSAAPATVTGERSRFMPLGFVPGKAAGKAMIREPGDLPMTVVRPRAGCTDGKRGWSDPALSRHGRHFVHDRRLRVQISVFPDGFGNSRGCARAKPERASAGGNRRATGRRNVRCSGCGNRRGGPAARPFGHHGDCERAGHRPAQHRPVGDRDRAR